MELMADIRPTFNEDWVFIVMILALTYLAILKRLRSGEFSLLLRAGFSQKASDLLLREKSGLNQLFYTLPIFVVAFSLLLNFDQSNIGTFSYLVLSGIGFVLAKFLVILLLVFIFEIKENKELILYSFLYEKLAGLILVPLLFLLFYSPYYQPEIRIFIYSSMLILLAYKFIRLGYLSFFQTTFSKAHIIIYLCTLEILPLILLSKNLL